MQDVKCWVRQIASFTSLAFFSVVFYFVLVFLFVLEYGVYAILTWKCNSKLGCLNISNLLLYSTLIYKVNASGGSLKRAMLVSAPICSRPSGMQCGWFWKLSGGNCVIQMDSCRTFTLSWSILVPSSLGDSLDRNPIWNEPVSFSRWFLYLMLMSIRCIVNCLNV